VVDYPGWQSKGTADVFTAPARRRPGTSAFRLVFVSLFVFLPLFCARLYSSVLRAG
jgi:hypothetical protein